MRIPFAYIIESKDHLYVGSKYGVDAHPSILLKTYFTSSKYAKPLILKNLEGWKITSIYEATSTQDALRQEMEWQLLNRHDSRLLNKSINRAEGKWINYGAMSIESRKKLSDSKKGKPASKVTIEAARLANTGRRCPNHVRDHLRKIKTGIPRNETDRKAISEAMKNNGACVGAKNPNAFMWVLMSPNGKFHSQPSHLAGREFISSLGLSYQMISKFLKEGKDFTGKQKGWSIVTKSR